MVQNLKLFFSYLIILNILVITSNNSLNLSNNKNFYLTKTHNSQIIGEFGGNPFDDFDPTKPPDIHKNFEQSDFDFRNKSRSYTGNINLPFYYNPAYTFNYFKNISDHIPYNNFDECGYVSLTMLLSYYDSYWNDRIVNDIYDSPILIESMDDNNFDDSPGVKIYNNINRNDFTKNEYINLMISQKEYNFTGFLFDLAQKNYLNQNFYENFNLMIQYDENNQPTEKLTLGLSIYGFVSLIQRYLYETNFSSYFDINFRYYNQLDFSNFLENKYSYIEKNNNVMNIIKSLVKEGIPVFSCGYLNIEDCYNNIINLGLDAEKNQPSAHYVIFSYYDEDNDVLYANFGYRNWELQPITLNKFAVSSAGYLEPKGNFYFPSNNYKKNDSTYNSSNLESHIHSSYVLDSGTSEHLRICTCGGYYQYHFYDSLLEENLQKCLLCKHKKIAGDYIYD